MRRTPWPSRVEPEGGFTLVEVLIAMVIIGTVLVVMGATMYTAFGSISFSRQRDTATQLANQAMEQIKAMNFNDLEMSTGDLSGDPLVSCAANCVFATRTIPTVSSGTLPTSPLDPHISTQTPTSGTSVYTIASYITFDSSQNTQDRVATVRVTWTHPAQGTNAVVQIESTIFANGAIASGPAHAWTADATDSVGNISVTGSIVGTSLVDVKLGPGSAHASIGVDGTATATGNIDESHVQLAGASLLKTNPSAASASSAPGQGVSAPAATVVNNTSVLGPQPGSGVIQLVNLILSLVGGNIGLSGPAGTVATTQAVAASSANGAANVSNGAGGVGTMPNSSLPYAQGLSQQTGPVYAGLTLSVVGLLSQTLQVLSITPLGNNNPDLATVCQQTNSGAGCQNALPATGNASGASQPSYAGPAIEAQAQKSFADISVLPLAGTPLLDISGFTAAASAAAGPGLSNTGLAKVNALSVKLLGNPIPLSSLIAGVTGSSNVSFGLLGTGAVTVNLRFGSATTSANSATITSPLALSVTVSLAGLVNLTVNVNFGAVSATANYS